MAGNAVIGALRVVLGADTAAFDKGLKDAQGGLKGFAKQVSTIAAGVSLAGIAEKIANEFSYALKQGFVQADELGKKAQSFGVPVEELSRLKHAADLSGVSIDSLGKGLGILSKNMMNVAGGATDDTAQAFKTLGIAVKDSDGNLRSSSAIMAEVAGKFAGMEDGAGKTALAMRLFGRSGAELIPLLNSGKAGLHGMMEEAEKLGLVIDTKTFKAAEAFNDNLTRMARIKDGIIMQVTARMAPAFLHLSQVMLDAAKNSTVMQQAADGITTFLKGTITAGLSAVLVFQRMGAELSALWGVVSNVGNWSKMSEAWATFRAEGQATEAAFAKLKDFTAKFWEDSAATAEATAADTGRRISAPIVEAASVANKVVSEGEALYKRAVQNAKTVFEETRTPFEEYKLRLAEISMLHQQGLITADTWARAQEQAAQRAGLSFDKAVPAILGSVQEIAQGFGQENARMAKAAQVIGAVQALIATMVGSAEALKLPFPANLAASAAVLAKGLGVVAAIKSQKVSGFKTGGSFRVPGGMGGGDKVHAAFEPGEIVDVWRPGEGDRDQRGGGRSMTEVTVNLAGEIFSRETLRKMIDGLNEMSVDGYKLKIA